MLEDPNLVQRIRERDPETLAKVSREYLTQVFRAARGAGLDTDRAEDVTQATFMTFIEKAHTYEGRSKIRTWIFGILFRKISESRREDAREAKYDPIDEQMESRFGSDGAWIRAPRPVDQQVYESEVRVKLGECLSNAPEMQRNAFRLREIEGFSTEEICKILEVSRTNLGVLLFRIRNRLRECLESKGIDGSTDA